MNNTMGDQPFTNRELKKYFEDFRNDLTEIKEDIQLARKVDNARFIALERDIIELKIKQENVGTKIAGIVFIVATAVGIIINRLFQ
jgi:type IV secretory pathway component VirB8